MACVQVQCLVPPCPEICDGEIITGSPQTVDPMLWSTELPSRNIDPALLMQAPSTYRNYGSYSGGQYPSGNVEPDFRVSTESLDYWRLVLLAIGVIIGVAVLKR